MHTAGEPLTVPDSKNEVHSPREHKLPSQHVPALDGLRGVAILLVMLLHFGGSETLPGLKRMDLNGLEKAYLKVVDAGACGVDLFFVLSGFLITGILFDTKNSQRFFRTFYFRRTLRIFPLYYGVLVAVFCFLPLLHLANSSALDQVGERQAGLWLYCTNIVIAWEETTVYNVDWLQFSHFWSLAVEEHFYLIWPAVIFACSRKNAMKVCVGCMAVALALRLGFSGMGHKWSAYVLTPCRMDALVLGAWLALASRGPGGMRGLLPWAWILAPLSFGLILLLSFTRNEFPSLGWPIGALSSSLYATFFGAILIFAVNCRAGSLGEGLYCNRVLRTLGKYSYGLYVLHYLLRPALHRLIPADTLAGWTGSPFLGLFLYASLAIACSIIAAWLSWHVLEKHFLKLKKYFTYETTDNKLPTVSRNLPPAILSLPQNA
ncbi:MAG: acyltransferase family protein [Gemmataceae bacterium]